MAAQNLPLSTNEGKLRIELRRLNWRNPDPYNEVCLSPPGMAECATYDKDSDLQSSVYVAYHYFLTCANGQSDRHQFDSSQKVLPLVKSRL